MKLANYNAIKEKIAKYVERINLLKYPGYEKDLDYLKGLCDYYRRTMSPSAENMILNDLHNFAIKLKKQEFMMVISKDELFQKIMFLKKNNTRLGLIENKDAIQKLFTDYVNFAWKHYDEVEIDCDFIMSIKSFNERLERINSSLNKQNILIRKP